jgi:hypothetical protein
VLAHLSSLRERIDDGIQAWSDLRLSLASDGQPLYVGKPEGSLNGRDDATHLAAGKTD